MTPKEHAFKLISDRIDNISQLAMEGIELIWKAAYNEAIEDAAVSIKYESDGMSHEGIIRKLKK